MCDFNAPLFTFYHKKARTLFLVKKKNDKIFCFDYLNDNSIQLSQVLNLKDNYIYHICLAIEEHININAYELAKLVYLSINN